MAKMAPKTVFRGRPESIRSKPGESIQTKPGLASHCTDREFTTLLTRGKSRGQDGAEGGFSGSPRNHLIKTWQIHPDHTWPSLTLHGP